jgi:hypothetical protein
MRYPQNACAYHLVKYFLALYNGHKQHILDSNDLRLLSHTQHTFAHGHSNRIYLHTYLVDMQ